MLSMKAFSSASSAAHYFEKDNYYHKDSPEAKQASQWWGEGAKALALSGDIDKKTFEALLSGYLPDGQKVGKLIREKGIERLQHRPGTDLTFSAPKSFSIIAYASRDKSLFEAHDKAVTTVLDYIEKNFATYRVTQKGETYYQKSDNLLFAKFLHDLSRDGDPHVHTHALLMNLTQRADGQWRSLASQSHQHVQTEGEKGVIELIGKNKLFLGQLYRAELAYELKQLGYEIRQTHKDGRFEIDGVSTDIIDHYSKRRQAIEKAMSEKGLTGSRAAAVATQATRKPKQITSHQQHHQSIRHELVAMGLSLHAITTLKSHQACQQKNMTDVTKLARSAVTYAYRHLTEREAVFSKSSLLATALSHQLGDLQPKQILAAFERAVKRGDIIAREKDFTTAIAIEREKRTLVNMLAGQNQVSPIISPPEIEQRLTSQPLNDGQRTAAALILSTSDRFVNVQGYAGTGKTHMMKVVKDIAGSGDDDQLSTPAKQQIQETITTLLKENTHGALKIIKTMSVSQGYTMVGFAPSAKAAKALSDAAGIEAMTLSMFLIEMNKVVNAKGERIDNDKHDYSKTLFVLDESSMSSSAQYDHLIHAITAINGRLVAIGDIKQHTAVDAGKPFEQSQEAGIKTAIMDDIVRQKTNPVLLGAVYDAVNGHIDNVFDKLSEHIIEAPEPSSSELNGLATSKQEKMNLSKHLRDINRLTLFLDTYKSLPDSEKESTLLIAPGNKDRVFLNESIRQYRQQQGLLGHEDRYSTILIDTGMTQTERAHVGHYERGYMVRFNRTYTSIGVEKGQYYRVDAINNKQQMITLSSQHGDKVIQWQPYKVGGRRRGAIEVYEQKERPLSVGEKILWRRNHSREKGIVNSETANVTNLKNKIATIELANKKQIAVDLSKPSNQHWDYSYVLTTYAAQGATVNRALVTMSSLQKNLSNMRTLYVAISRQKKDLQLIVDNKRDLIEKIASNPAEKSTALESYGKKTAMNNDPSHESKKSSIDHQSTKIIHEQPKRLWRADDILKRLTEQTEHVSEKMLGPANHKTSTKQQLRFGSNKGSLIVTLQGEKRGCWYDFSTGQGGNLLNLIQQYGGYTFSESLDFAATLLGLDKSQAFREFQQKSPQKTTTRIANNSPVGLNKRQKQQQHAGLKLFNGSKPIASTLAEIYLTKHRQLNVPNSQDLRFHPAVYNHEMHKHVPALLAVMRNRHGDIQSIEATFLDSNTANKAPVNTQRKKYGPAKGGQVLVHKGGAQVAIAEGVETALSIAKAKPNFTVYATLGVNNMQHLSFYQSKLLLCFDNDGKEANSTKTMKAVVKNLTKNGQECRIAIPPVVGQDFNDVLKNQGENAIKTMIDNSLTSPQSLSAFIDTTGSKRIKTYEKMLSTVSPKIPNTSIQSAATSQQMTQQISKEKERA